MNFGRQLLKAMYPKHEEQRRELRKAILEAEANAEDIIRTCRGMPKTTSALKSKVNGAQKEV